MSGIFDERRPFPRRPAGAPRRRPRALLPTLAVVIALLIALAVFTNVWTERLWYKSIDYSEVFNKILATRTLLFIIFGAALGSIVVLNVWLAYRFRPRAHGVSIEQQNLDRYRDAVEPLRRWILVAIGVILAIFGGSNAAGDWKTFLLWRHGSSFGVDDQIFHRDIGFFVFDYPFYRMVIGYLFAIVILSLIGVVATNYLYGGIQLQGRGRRISDAAQVHLSALLGVFMLLKAVAYWLDRYGLAIADGGLFTGVSYTDDACRPAGQEHPGRSSRSSVHCCSSPT